MKINYRQAQYAPEQLEIFLNGKLLNKKIYSRLGYEFYKAENKVAFIRERLFARKEVKRSVTVGYEYEDKQYSRFDTEFSGLITNGYSDIKKMKEHIKTRATIGAYKVSVKFNKLTKA